MRDKDLRKLNRQDLLKLLLAAEKENRRLSEALEASEAKLAERELRLSEAGNMAEAALALNGVLESAQRAAEEYQRNVRSLCERRDQESRRLAAERVELSRRMLSETQARCREMEKAARALYRQAAEGTPTEDGDWDDVYAILGEYLDEHPALAGGQERHRNGA